jgi:hypothetical protein
MRWPWTRTPPLPVDAHKPHEYREPDGRAMSTGFGGGRLTSGGTAMGPIAMTSAHLRTSRCGVPGCGKDRHDPIHEPAE